MLVEKVSAYGVLTFHTDRGRSVGKVSITSSAIPFLYLDLAPRMRDPDSYKL